jgi:DME family drug/metabolite transporter
VLTTGGLRPLLLVVVAAALWGTVGTARVLGPAASSWSVGALRLAVGAAVLVALARVVDGRAGTPRDVLRLAARPASLLAGAGQALFQVTFLAAVELTGVAVGTLVAIGSAPVFTGLLTRSVERAWLAATGCAVVGVALLAADGRGEVAPLGVLAALGAGMGYATYTVASRSLAGSGHPPASVAAAGFLVAALLLAPALALTDQAWARSAGGAVLVLYLGVVATAVAYLLFVAGLRHVAAPTAQTLGLAEPVVATTLGVAVLGERLGPLGALGCALVVAGLALLARTAAADRRVRLRTEEAGQSGP